MTDLTSMVVDVDITAISSIVHRDDSRAMSSTHTLFRREKILTPTGDVAVIPIVSGNAWRGALRRLGETLIAPILNYDGQLTPPAAHLLRNGGFLRKSTTEMTPEDERHLKSLIPLIALFGGAGNGRIMSGKITVSKVIPVTADTLHLLPFPIDPSAAVPTSIHAVLGQESISHGNDLPPGVGDLTRDDASSPIRLDTETLIAGTQLAGQLRLHHLTPLEYAFARELLDTFAHHGHLGGRTAAGHGRIRATTIHRAQDQPEHADIDWRAHLSEHRDDALAALNTLT